MFQDKNKNMFFYPAGKNYSILDFKKSDSIRKIPLRKMQQSNFKKEELRCSIGPQHLSSLLTAAEAPAPTGR